MPNKGVKVLRTGSRKSAFWYNSRYFANRIDYEICAMADRKGSSVSDRAFGILWGARLSGWWGLKIAGECASLRGNNTLRHGRFGVNVLGLYDGNTNNPAFTWSAGVKYRMRVQIAEESPTQRRTKIWVWADGDTFPEGSPLVNYVASGNICSGYIGIVGGSDWALCDRIYVFEDIVHSFTNPVNFAHTAIPDRPAYDILTHSDWKAIEPMSYLELAYKGTRKTGGYFLYEPKNIMVDKPFPNIGSTNFSEYHPATLGKIPSEDFADVWNSNMILSKITGNERSDTEVCLKSTVGSAQCTVAVYKKLGKLLNGQFLTKGWSTYYTSIAFRVDDSTANPTCYIVSRNGPTTLDLWRHNNNASRTSLVKASSSIPSGMPAYLYHYIRVEVNGNNIKARDWFEGMVEPDTWSIDYTDESGSAILTEGYVGFGENRATSGTLNMEGLALAWAPLGEMARFPVNTLVKWGEDKTNYGKANMSFATNESPTEIPPDDNWLKAENWGVIPSFPWDLGTEGIDKYLWSRLHITKGSCNEESPASGKETDVIIEGDLCSTLLDDNVVKRYRNKICYIDGYVPRAIEFKSEFAPLGYYIEWYTQTEITLAKIQEFDLVVIANYVEDTNFYDLIASVISAGIPVVIGSQVGTWDGVKMPEYLRYVDGSMFVVQGAIGSMFVLVGAKIGLFGELTDPLIESETVPNLNKIDHFNPSTTASIGRKLMARLADSNQVISLGIEQGTLDLDSNPINARVAWLGWLSSLNYPSSWNTTWRELLRRSIEWVTGVFEEGIFGNINITVKDKISQNPIENAYVSIDGLRYGFTNSNGTISFVNVPVNSDALYVQKTLYTEQIMVVGVIAESTINVVIELELISAFFITQFGEYGIKSGLPFSPDEWESIAPAVDSEFSIVTEDIPTSLSGQVFQQIEATASGFHLALVKTLTSPNAIIYVRTKPTATVGTSARIWLPFRITDINNFYYIGMRLHVFEIARVVGGTFTQLAVNNLSSTLVQHKYNWVRIEFDGTILSAKLWRGNYIKLIDLELMEPDAELSITDANFSNGQFGIGGLAGTHLTSHFSVHNL